MSTRHIARSIVIQTLFEGDMQGWLETPSQHAEEFSRSLSRNLSEYAQGAKIHDFAHGLLTLTLSKRPVLDDIIIKAAPEWPLEKIANVDRNILRLGLAELLYGDRTQVPPKVAIDQAIELAKSFGGETSGRFVNGVLGGIYKQMGEPGKQDRVRPEVVRKPEQTPSELPQEKLVGAVVYARNTDGAMYIALVHDIFGKWTLPKGHVDAGLDYVDSATKKVKEELRIDVTIEEKIGENEYVAVNPEKRKVRKHVTYYTARAPFTEINFVPKEGIDNAQWFPIMEVIDLPMYEDLTPILVQAIKKITGARTD